LLLPGLFRAFYITPNCFASRLTINFKDKYQLLITKILACQRQLTPRLCATSGMEPFWRNALWGSYSFIITEILVHS